MISHWFKITDKISTIVITDLKREKKLTFFVDVSSRIACKFPRYSRAPHDHSLPKRLNCQAFGLSVDIVLRSHVCTLLTHENDLSASVRHMGKIEESFFCFGIVLGNRSLESCSSVCKRDVYQTYTGSPKRRKSEKRRESRRGVKTDYGAESRDAR